MSQSYKEAYERIIERRKLIDAEKRALASQHNPAINAEDPYLADLKRATEESESMYVMEQIKKNREVPKMIDTDEEMARAIELSLLEHQNASSLHEAIKRSQEDYSCRLHATRLNSTNTVPSIHTTDSQLQAATAAQLQAATRFLLSGKDNFADGGFTFKANGVLYTNMCAIIVILMGMLFLKKNYNVRLTKLADDLCQLAETEGYSVALYQLYTIVRTGIYQKDTKFTNQEIDEIINFLDLHVIRLDTGDEGEVEVGNRAYPVFSMVMVGAHWYLYIGALTQQEILFKAKVISAKDVFKGLNVSESELRYVINAGIVQDNPVLWTVVRPDIL